MPILVKYYVGLNRFCNGEYHGVFYGDMIYKSKKGDKDQESIPQVPHLSQDTTWVRDKITIKHHKQEPKGQPFPSR